MQRRGSVAKLLVIGEAPGEIEDHKGEPFVGPSGSVIEYIFGKCIPPFEYLITNTVCCRPVLVGEKSGLPHYENREPTKAEMELCRDHIIELHKVFQPDGIVYLGEVATSYKKKFFPTKVPTLKLLHPAYILRLEFQLLTKKKAWRKLEGFLRTLYEQSPRLCKGEPIPMEGPFC